MNIIKKSPHRNIKVQASIALISSIFFTGCQTPTYQDYKPPVGYELIYTSTNGHKWFYAPSSKQPTVLRGRDPQSGQIELKPAMTVSVMIIPPNPWYPPISSVEALACEAIPGTFFKQSADKRGWDTAQTTEPHGTVRWQIWQSICAK